MFLALTFFIHNLELDAWAVRLNAPAQNHRIPTRRERSRSQNQSVTSDNFRKDLENHKIVLVLLFVASLFIVFVFVAVFWSGHVLLTLINCPNVTKTSQ